MYYKIIVLFVFFFCISCSVNNNSSIQKIVTSVTYQNWVSGVRNGGKGYLVNLTLIVPLPRNIKLDSLQIFDKIASVNQIDSLHYQANCLISIHSDNEAITTPSSSFKLNKNEVLIMFNESGIKKQQIIKNIKELSFNAFPIHNIPKD